MLDIKLERIAGLFFFITELSESSIVLSLIFLSGFLKFRPDLNIRERLVSDNTERSSTGQYDLSFLLIHASSEAFCIILGSEFLSTTRYMYSDRFTVPLSYIP